MTSMMPKVGQSVQYFTQKANRVDIAIGEGPYAAVITRVHGKPDQEYWSQVDIIVFLPQITYREFDVPGKAVSEKHGHSNYWQYDNEPGAEITYTEPVAPAVEDKEA